MSRAVAGGHATWVTKDAHETAELILRLRDMGWPFLPTMPAVMPTSARFAREWGRHADLRGTGVDAQERDGGGVDEGRIRWIRTAHDELPGRAARELAHRRTIFARATSPCLSRK
jgi:hypothetical protein